MRPPVALPLLAALAALLPLLPGCSCSGGSAPERLVRREVRKPAQALPSPLQVFLDERRAQQSARHDREVARKIEAATVDPKLLEGIGGDVELHEFLKTGVALFKENRLEEALAEFDRVARQHPDDRGLLCVAEKNIAITFLKMGRRDDYLTHVARYAELLAVHLDESDRTEMRENSPE